MYLGGTLYSIIYCKMSTKRDITSQKVDVIGFSKNHIWKGKLCKTWFIFFRVIFLQVCLEKCLLLTFICLRSGENCGVLSLDIIDTGRDLVNVCSDLFHVEEELVHLAPLHRHGHVLSPDIILIRLGLEIVKLSYKSYINNTLIQLIKLATME